MKPQHKFPDYLYRSPEDWGDTCTMTWEEACNIAEGLNNDVSHALDDEDMCDANDCEDLELVNTLATTAIYKGNLVYEVAYEGFAINGCDQYKTVNTWCSMTECEAELADGEIEQIAEGIWDALDNARDDKCVGLRGDDAVVKSKFRKSWNRPDGTKTTRLPGVSTYCLGYDSITFEQVVKAVAEVQSYGKNIYLLEGDSPNDLQYLANDPGERIFTTHRILYRYIAP